MVRKILTLILFAGLAQITPASALETLLLGGGGDPKGESTTFDDSLRELAKEKNTLSLHLDASFDGEHATTESILANELNVSSVNFTKTSFQSKIDSYVQKITNGEIASGQELMIIIDTHGASPSGTTHNISTVEKPLTDYDHLAENSSVSMDALAALSKTAQEKKVKLAILDLSCHSGSSLPLANEYTCVLTGSGPDLYAYSNFPVLLYQEMKHGDNLENAFLRARKKQALPSFPMISTPSGLTSNDLLYGLLNPYMRSADKEGDKPFDDLSAYLKSLATSNGFCQRDQDFGQLLEQIRHYQEITHQVELKTPEGADILAELQQYKKIQDDLAREIQSDGYGNLTNTEVITYGPPTKDKTGKMVMKTDKVTWQEIMMGYPPSTIVYLNHEIAKQKAAKKPDEQLIAEDYGVIEKIKKIEAIREQIKTQFPKILDPMDLQKDLLEKSALLTSKAMAITNLANILYDSEYQAQKAQSHSSDACRDFTF
jgi:mannose/fructose-specific phosphotransferase system component IIA